MGYSLFLTKYRDSTHFWTLVNSYKGFCPFNASAISHRRKKLNLKTTQMESEEGEEMACFSLRLNFQNISPQFSFDNFHLLYWLFPVIFTQCLKRRVCVFDTTGTYNGIFVAKVTSGKVHWCTNSEIVPLRKRWNVVNQFLPVQNTRRHYQIIIRAMSVISIDRIAWRSFSITYHDSICIERKLGKLLNNRWSCKMMRIWCTLQEIFPLNLLKSWYLVRSSCFTGFFKYHL